MYTIDFDPKLEKTLKKWKKSNPLLFKKLTKILLAIQEDPRHGKDIRNLRSKVVT